MTPEDLHGLLASAGDPVTLDRLAELRGLCGYAPAAPSDPDLDDDTRAVDGALRKALAELARLGLARQTRRGWLGLPARMHRGLPIGPAGWVWPDADRRAAALALVAGMFRWAGAPAPRPVALLGSPRPEWCYIEECYLQAVVHARRPCRAACAERAEENRRARARKAAE